MSYDHQDQVIEYAIDEWISESWHPLIIDSSWYDGDGMIQTIISYVHDSTGWSIDQKFVYNFDGQGRQVSVLRQYLSARIWNNVQLTVWNYSAGRTSSVLDQIWVLSNWQNWRLTSYNYDNSVLTTVIGQIWNASRWNNEWEDRITWKNVWMIDVITSVLWSNEQWKNDFRTSNEYDDTGRMLLRLRENWATTHWYYYWKELYSYHQSGELSEIMLLMWNRQTGYWNGDQKLAYYYSQPTVVNPDSSPKPNYFSLKQNTPNPFNPATTIEYSVQRKSHIELVIYNLLGMKVRTLVDETLSRGNYTSQWNGRDKYGNQVASGLYFYRLQTESGSTTKKMILLR